MQPLEDPEMGGLSLAGKAHWAAWACHPTLSLRGPFLSCYWEGFSCLAIERAFFVLSLGGPFCPVIARAFLSCHWEGFFPVIARTFFPVIARSEATKQSRSSPGGPSVCFASLATTELGGCFARKEKTSLRRDRRAPLAFFSRLTKTESPYAFRARARAWLNSAVRKGLVM